MPTHPRIVFIGGGSPNWLPRIGTDMLLTGALHESELVLHDIDPAAARRVEAYLRQVARALGSAASVRAVDALDEALTGADYVVITITTGGLDAMAHDLAIPEAYGIHHTVGDTAGPGGWARFLRNAPVFRHLAAAIRRCAPGAMVLNYTNPMTTLTQVLAGDCTGPVVGLCHGLFENQEFLKKLHGLASDDDLALSYGGLNHFFWVTRGRATGGGDILADLHRRLRTRSFAELDTTVYTDPAGHAGTRRELATDLARRTGVMPYIADRHTCEFLPGVITDREAMARLKLVRTTIGERQRLRSEAIARLDGWIATGALAPDARQRSRETAADIIAAHREGRPFIDVGNLPNRGQIPNLPHGLIVETPMCVDRNGFTAVQVGELPAPVMALVAPPAHAMDLLVRAYLAEDRSQVFAALAADPVCSHLPHARVVELGSRLAAAHAAAIPAWMGC